MFRAKACRLPQQQQLAIMMDRKIRFVRQSRGHGECSYACVAASTHTSFLQNQDPHHILSESVCNKLSKIWILQSFVGEEPIAGLALAHELGRNAIVCRPIS